MWLGMRNRASAIDRLVIVLANIGVTVGEQLILTARRKMAGGAIGGNVLLYRQKQTILDQQASSVRRGPMWTNTLAQPLGFVGFGIVFVAKGLFTHEKIFAKNDPTSVFVSHRYPSRKGSPMSLIFPSNRKTP